MTRRIYSTDKEPRPLPARIPFQPTHVLRAPNPKGKEHFVPRVMELRIEHPSILDAFVQAGWQVLEVIEK